MAFQPIVRRIENSERALYLTFDDGPDSVGTPLVLEVLRQHQVPATFFLVAEKAQSEKDLLEKIRRGGHAIGNHSLDHGYRSFFLGQTVMLEWIQKAETVFKNLGIEPVGFRPPAGIRTPELHRALSKLGIPLVLWDERFYDTRFSWTIERANRSLARINPGAIILLHDRQKAARVIEFTETLSFFIAEGQKRGFQFRALSRELCETGRAGVVGAVAGATTGATGATTGFTGAGRE